MNCEVTESGLQIGLWKVLVLTLCCVIWTGHRTFHASFLGIGVLCETQIVSTASRAVNYLILLPLLLSKDCEHLGIWGSKLDVLAPEEKLLASRGG